jgi:hypothetical protein
MEFTGECVLVYTDVILNSFLFSLGNLFLSFFFSTFLLLLFPIRISFCHTKLYESVRSWQLHTHPPRVRTHVCAKYL